MPKLIELDKMLSDIKGKYNYALGKRDIVRDELSKVERELAENQRLSSIYTESVEIFKKLDNEVRQKTISKFEDIMTQIYRFVFDNEDKIVLECSIKRNNLAVEFFVKRGKLLLDPMEECGGGVVDVLQFALRIASILLIKPKLDNFVVLDEPFKHLSEAYRGKAVELFRNLSTNYNLQMVLTTHHREFSQCADKIFEIDMVDNVSTVKETMK